MTEEEFIKILRKKANERIHVEKNKARLIRNAYDYFKGVHDGKVVYARDLLSELK